ncbi:MAG TPA: hypothetical protein VER79_06890 [Candidatus Limnocylindrales bacterium]|nr:hypothetical protein [Candidatus Limnocylindrales bacterium]
MADERNQRLMHEALDDQLTPEALDTLYTGLDTDPKNASVFERLRTVDRMLKEAPFENAPQTLALRVLAKIADIRPEQLRRGAGLALALGLGLAALLLLPLLGALGWLVINVLSNPAAAVQAVIGVLASLIGVITSMVQSVQVALQSSPLVPAALAALLPAGYFVLRRIRGQRQDQARRERLGGPPADEENE